METPARAREFISARLSLNFGTRNIVEPPSPPSVVEGEVPPAGFVARERRLSPRYFYAYADLEICRRPVICIAKVRGEIVRQACPRTLVFLIKRRFAAVSLDKDDIPRGFTFKSIMPAHLTRRSCSTIRYERDSAVG